MRSNHGRKTFFRKMPGFPDRLAELMKARGFTQASLARALQISQSTISRWREGSTPQHRVMQNLAAVLRTTPDWLLRGEGSRDNEIQQYISGQTCIYRTPAAEPRGGSSSFARLAREFDTETLCGFLQALLGEVRRTGALRADNAGHLRDGVDELLRRYPPGGAEE